MGRIETEKTTVVRELVFEVRDGKYYDEDTGEVVAIHRIITGQRDTRFREEEAPPASGHKFGKYPIALFRRYGGNWQAADSDPEIYRIYAETHEYNERMRRRSKRNLNEPW